MATCYRHNIDCQDERTCPECRYEQECEDRQEAKDLEQMHHDKLVELQEDQIELQEDQIYQLQNPGSYQCPECLYITLKRGASRCPICHANITKEYWPPIYEREREETEKRAQIAKIAAKKLEEPIRKRDDINQKIADVEAKANPYRDKREQLVRVKEARPLEINVPHREKGEEFKGAEEITSHARRESPSSESEDKKKFEVSSYISGWNVYIKNHEGSPKEMIVDINDFVKKTTLPANHKLEFKDFKNILTRYYKVKKVPIDKLNQHIDKFFQEKINSKK